MRTKYFAVWALLASGMASRAADAGCDRACLEGFVNQYLDALVAQDPSRLPLAKDGRYTENGQALKLGDGMWGPKVALGTYKLYFAAKLVSSARLPSTAVL